jgi:hypothetical protein
VYNHFTHFCYCPLHFLSSVILSCSFFLHFFSSFISFVIPSLPLVLTFFFICLSTLYILERSRNSDWLRALRPRDRSSNPSGLKQVLQTGSGAHPISYSMGNRGSFPGNETAGGWSSPLISNWCRGKKTWVYTSTPPYVFMEKYFLTD